MPSRWLTLGVQPPQHPDRVAALRFVRDLNAGMLLIVLLAAIPIVLILGTFGLVLIGVVLAAGALDLAYLTRKLGRLREHGGQAGDDPNAPR